MDIEIIVFNLTHLGIAYLLALPVGFDRERASTGAGLRTFPLVSVAACGYTLVGIGVLDSTGAEARVLQGIITGIGFNNYNSNTSVKQISYVDIPLKVGFNLGFFHI